MCHVGSAVVLMVMAIFFWDCTFPLLIEIREHPEFHGLMEMDKCFCLVVFCGMDGYLCSLG